MQLNIDSSPTITLFKEQLNNQISLIKGENQLDNNGKAFIYWYFKNFYDMTYEDISEICSDGSGDMGIDAIYIDDDEIIHFYQFKNPSKITDGFDGGDVDKVLSGLNLIISHSYQDIVNPKLKKLIENIYNTVPNGYKLHLVTSGSGISAESQIKLDTFISNLGSNEDFMTYEIEDIIKLQDRFYRRNVPTVGKAINFKIERQPYMIRSANHDSYIFHLPAETFAKLYEEYNELLLQQNIRTYEGNNSTNKAIYHTCTTDDSLNFYHFNNGVTFICDKAQWDGFNQQLTLEKAQIVNGGQTVRVLHKAFIEEKLRKETLISTRVITTGGDKDFAANVAVNLNNQTTVEPSFLRSNDQRIIQLSSSLMSLNWYLERREGEIDSLSMEERSKLEKRIGHTLDTRTIPLKEGAQAYTATYFRNPELSRKNPKLIFSDDEGGYFKKIFSTDLTALKFLQSYRLYRFINSFVEDFKTLKRKKRKMSNWREEYSNLFGTELVSKYDKEIDQAIPQATHMILAIYFEYFVRIKKLSIDDIIQTLEKNNISSILEIIKILFDFYASHPDDTENKTWQTLLKSQSFFEKVCDYLKMKVVPN